MYMYTYNYRLLIQKRVFCSLCIYIYICSIYIYMYNTSIGIRLYYKTYNFKLIRILIYTPT